MSRAPVTFGGFSRRRQFAVLVVAPIVFGLVAGPVLGWSGAGWWALQALGVLGAVLAGHDHRTARAAALRGAVAGGLAALTVLAVHGAVGVPAATHFEADTYPVYAVVVSAALHAVGAVRRRWTRARSARRGA